MMSSSSSFLRWVIVAFSAVVVWSCDTPPPQAPIIDPGFMQFVSAYTSGTISSGDVIRIRLAADYRTGSSDTSDAPSDLFRFHPSIKGRAVWTDARTVEFRPDQPLPQGKVITGRFYLSKLMDVPEQFRIFPLLVEVMPQRVGLLSDGLTVTDPPEGKVYSFSGKLLTADIADAASVEKCLRVELDGKKIAVAWDHLTDRKTHIFLIDSILRADRSRDLKISWDGNPVGAPSEGEELVIIPATGDFSLLGVQVLQEPEQSVMLCFSDPLDRDQPAEGLVRIGDLTDLRYAVVANRMEIFLPAPVQGKKILTAGRSLRNTRGMTLGKDYSRQLMFEDVKPSVQLLGKGVILPSSQGMVLPFRAVNLSRVDLKVIKIYEDNIRQFLQVNSLDNNYELQRVGVRVHEETLDLLKQKPMDPANRNTYFCDLSRIIGKEPGAIYHIILSFKKDYSLYVCPDAGGEGSNLTSDGEEEDNGYGGDDYSDFYGFWPRGYNWYQRDNPCHVSYYTPDRMVRRNLLASDLGIIAKAGSGNEYRFFISSLLTTQPVEGAGIEVYDYTNQLLARASTDKKGMAVVALKAKPWLVTVRKDGQHGYLRVDDGSALSLSRFDVAGTGVKDGMKGFAFGERGVWRPGDTLFLTFILQNKLEKLPAGYPATLDLTNPRGQLYTRMTRINALNGFYSFAVPTDENVPTGNWTATFRAGGLTVTRNIKIETVKPNRLRLNLDFDTPMLRAGKSIAGKFTSSWLTGAPAPDLKLMISAKLSGMPTSFSGYPEFIFEDPSRRLEAEEQILFDGRTDQNGNASVTGMIQHAKDAPGMLLAGFMTSLFEEGGDFSRDYFSLPFSPYPVYVGIRLPVKEHGAVMLQNDRDHAFEIVTLDESGKPVSRKGLEAEIIKLQWRWWWNGSDNDYATYEGTMEKDVKRKIALSTLNGKGTLSFRIDDDWGRYLVRVRDEAGHAAAAEFYLDFPYGSGSRDEQIEAATMLSFSTDKEEYMIGETATVLVPSGGEGHALVSIESGSVVLDAFWVSMKEKETKIPVKIKPEMAPGFYLHVSLIQPHLQTVNDLPVRMYGVVPVKVSDPSLVLNPEVLAPKEVRPEQPFTITVSEKSKRAMTYTLAIVDEGLLDLTRFRTPDPGQYFNAREALGVRTWDMYDYVIGAFGGRMEQLFAIGGDRDLLVSNPKKVNRFKPVVLFLGPFELKRGATASHKVQLPPYIGSVRVMVVAGQDGAFGNTESTVQVKNPLMVLTTLPRLLGPGEKVKVPVTVFAMDSRIRDVTVRVIPDNGFTDDPAEKSIRFAATGDQTVEFELHTALKTGNGRVRVICTSGSERAETVTDLVIRSANIRAVNVLDTVVEPGASWSAEYACPGMEGTLTAQLEAGGVLPASFGGRLDGLIQYPYGCLEQTVSAAFPQLYLPAIQNMTDKQAEGVRRNVTNALKRMKAFQQPGGYFSGWPGTPGDPMTWTSVYAGHFMIEAEQKGYTLPAGMKDAWLKHASGLALNFQSIYRETASYYSAAEFTQAYRLYVLALAGETRMAAMNRLRESGKLNAETRQRLAAAYILAGQKETGRKLLQDIRIFSRESPEMMETFGSEWRDKAMLLESWCLLGDLKRSVTLARELAGVLSSGEWLSTQTTAYSLVSLSRFLILSGDSRNGLSLTYTAGNKEPVKITSERPVFSASIPAVAKGGKITVKNTGSGKLYLRLLTSGIPAAAEESQAENDLRMTVTYKDLKGNILDVTRLKQATGFVAEVSVTNPGSIGVYRNLALGQIFPPGWEIVNSRLHDQASSPENVKLTYQDIRDDRVNSFFDLAAGETKRITVQLNATYMGLFYLPGAYCEAMYYNWIFARKKGMWVEVTANGR